MKCFDCGTEMIETPEYWYCPKCEPEFSKADGIACFGSLCPSETFFNPPKPKEDVSKVFERFAPNIVNREPDMKNADNFRELLPEALWKEYPSFMTAYLLDAGRLKVSELAPADQQLDTIRYLKSKEQWKDFPMLLKLSVFFGHEDKLSLSDTEQEVREEMRQQSLKVIEKEAKKLESERRLREIKQKARQKALREFYHPKSEDEIFQEILSHQLMEMMKNE